MIRLITWIFPLSFLLFFSNQDVAAQNRAYARVRATVVKVKPHEIRPDYMCIGTVVRKNASGMVLLYLYGNIYPGAGLLVSPVVPSAFSGFYNAAGTSEQAATINPNASVDIEGSGLLKIINDWLSETNEKDRDDPGLFQTYSVGNNLKVTGNKTSDRSATASFDVTINYN
jgi:hypothetical protein